MPSNDPLTLGLHEGSYVIGDGQGEDVPGRFGPEHHPCIHALAISLPASRSLARHQARPKPAVTASQH
jgi:hypothetical protein